MPQNKNSPLRGCFCSKQRSGRKLRRATVFLLIILQLSIPSSVICYTKRMNRKGFETVPIVIGIMMIIVIAFVVGGVVRYSGSHNNSSPAGVACTTEAKQCPDGSYVGRTGPNCAFATCPAAAASSTTQATAVSSTTTQIATTSVVENNTSTWQTLSDPSNLFTIQAPSNWDLQILESDTSTYAAKVDTISFPNGAILCWIAVLTPTQWQAISNSGGNNYLAGSSSQYYFVMTQTQDVEDTTNVSATEILANMLSVFSTFRITPAPTSSAIDTSDWKTYTNQTYGYQIKYPSNWYIDTTNSNSDFTARGESPVTYMGGDTSWSNYPPGYLTAPPAPADYHVITLIVYDAAKDPGTGSIPSSSDVGGVIDVKNFITNSGVSGTEFTTLDYSDNDNQQPWVYFTEGNYVYKFSSDSGSEAILEQMLSKLQFTSSTANSIQ